MSLLGSFLPFILLVAIVFHSQPSSAGKQEEQEEGRLRQFQCNRKWVDAVWKRLDSLQNPKDCSQTRLLVLETDSHSFEGIGSVLMYVAEAMAEAYYSNRTLIFGPPSAQPYFIRDAKCTVASKDGTKTVLTGWHCYFEPVSRKCSWDDVTVEERNNLLQSVDSCSSRVKFSTASRGGPSLYSAPVDIISHSDDDGDAWEDDLDQDELLSAVCWAGSVFGSVVRLNPWWQLRLDDLLREPELDLHSNGVNIDYVGVHLRVGDLELTTPQYGGRVYKNRPTVTASLVGDLLHAHLENLSHDEVAQDLPRGEQKLLQNNAFDTIYLATDSPNAPDAVKMIATHSGIRNVQMLPRFRSHLGSHTEAFAVTMMRENQQLLVPYEDLTELMSGGGGVGGDENDVSNNDDSYSKQKQVREESLEDLFLLSRSKLFVGSASSFFSTSAWLWSLQASVTGAKGDYYQLAPVIWADIDGVASGEYCNGFMHGQLNTTFALHHPEQRAIVFTRRWIDWVLEDGYPVIEFHPQYAVPIVPSEYMRRLERGWSCMDGKGPETHFIQKCLQDILSRSLGGRMCKSMAELINFGYDFWYQFNKELPIAAWNSVMVLPVGHFVTENEAVVARENYMGMMDRRKASVVHYHLKQLDE